MRPPSPLPALLPARLPVLLLAAALGAGCASAPVTPLRPAQEAIERFQQGKAILDRVDRELSQRRAGRDKMLGFLTEQERDDLVTALDHFREVFFLDPGGPSAAEALYLAGRTQDYGRLQQFERAMESYRQAFTRFPESEAGRLSRERYEKLKSMYEGIEGGSHGR